MFKEVTINTKNNEEIVDITEKVERLVKESNLNEGICTIFVKHTTASIIINENWDPSVGKDLLELLEEIAPKHKAYSHNDGNAHSHLKSAILGTSVTIPILNNELQLGRWQDIFLIEFDGPKERKIIVQIK
ncbi:YjbQ family protein [Candidatus Woesearchaeota archaeon]|nr:YjbQ family protein [Candidatus Woesearchaeota archaeon]